MPWPWWTTPGLRGQTTTALKKTWLRSGGLLLGTRPGNDVTTRTTPKLSLCGADKSRSTSSPILLETQFGIRNFRHPAATITPSDTRDDEVQCPLPEVALAYSNCAVQVYLAGQGSLSGRSSFVLEILTRRGLDRSESKLNLPFERFRNLKIRTSSCDPWPGRG